MKQLAHSELQRAAQLLEVIVRPGDHAFHAEIEEAQRMLGCFPETPVKVKRPRKLRMKRKHGFQLQ